MNAQTLRQNGFLPTNEAAQTLDVAPPTLRRRFNEGRGLAKAYDEKGRAYYAVVATASTQTSRYVSSEEMGDRLGVHRATVRRMGQRDELSVIQMGSRTLYAEKV